MPPRWFRLVVRSGVDSVDPVGPRHVGVRPQRRTAGFPVAVLVIVTVLVLVIVAVLVLVILTVLVLVILTVLVLVILTVLVLVTGRGVDAPGGDDDQQEPRSGDGRQADDVDGGSTASEVGNAQLV